jgi:hypothetical protein
MSFVYIISNVGWFVASWSSFSAVKGFWALRDTYESVYCYCCCHGVVIICFKGFWALWDNTVTCAMVMLLKEAFICLCAALWKHCTETKDCSLVHGLICACTYSYMQCSKTNVCVNAFQI